MSIAGEIPSGCAPEERNVYPYRWSMENGHSIDVGFVGVLVIRVIYVISLICNSDNTYEHPSDS